MRSVTYFVKFSSLLNDLVREMPSISRSSRAVCLPNPFAIHYLTSPNLYSWPHCKLYCQTTLEFKMAVSCLPKITKRNVVSLLVKPFESDIITLVSDGVR